MENKKSEIRNKKPLEDLISDLIHRTGAEFRSKKEYDRYWLRLEDLQDAIRYLKESSEIVRCKDCCHYDPAHVEKNGKRYEYSDLPKEAFGPFEDGYVTQNWGINVGGRCTVDHEKGYNVDKRVFRNPEDFCSKGYKKHE